MSAMASRGAGAGLTIEQVRLLLDPSPLPIWINQDDVVAYVNPAGWQLLGAAGPEEIVGRPVLEFVDAAFHEAVRQRVTRALLDGVAQPLMEQHFRRLDGRIVPVEVITWPIPLRNGMALQVSFADLSPRHQALAALEAARAYLHRIVDAVREPLLVLDAELTVRTANESYYRFFSSLPQQTEQHPLAALGQGEWNQPELLTRLRRVVQEGGTVENMLVSCDLPLQGQRLLRVNARQLPAHGEEPRLLLLAVEDTTERERAEESLRRSNQELQQFAYAASHDLQEPLRTVASYAQLLARRFEGRLDAQADEYLRYVVGGARRLQALVEALLSYAQLDGDRTPRQRVEADWAVAEVQQNLQRSIEEAGAEIQVAALPALRGNAAQVTQLFQNLVGNAIKYRREAAPRIEITAQPHEGGHLFCVRDNGQGFAPEQAERIFGVFQRLHGQAIPGAGIGLSICRRIVEQHGGRIWAESEPGVGSVFWFTLPRGDE